MHLFMQLKIPMKEIPPKSDLKSKFAYLNISSKIERIIIPIQILDFDNKIIMETKAIVDTGAIFSLMPGFLMTQFSNLKTIPHEIWGIVDTKEGKIEVELANVPVVLKDIYKNHSPIISITTAFATKIKVPVLLGMKGLLANYSYSFDAKNKFFYINF